MFKEVLTALADRGPVGCSLKYEHGESDLLERLMKTAIGTHQRSDGRGWLGFMLGQVVCLEIREGDRITGEVPQVQGQNAEMWRDTTQPLYGRQEEAGRRNPKGKAFADQPVDFILRVQCVGA